MAASGSLAHVMRGPHAMPKLAGRLDVFDRAVRTLLHEGGNAPAAPW